MSELILPRREKLRLPNTPRTEIFRLVEERLRCDQVLGRVVRTWRSWRGHPEDKAEISYAMAPAVRLTPRPAEDRWWVPFAVRGRLTIDLEVVTQGSCVDDLDNLWGAIVVAVRPKAPSAWDAWSAQLRAAGAWQGAVSILSPAYDARPEAGSDGGYRGNGAIAVEYVANVGEVSG